MQPGQPIETLNLRDRSFEAPFPPADLMYRVSGLSKEADFAHHGETIYRALSGVAPVDLLSCESVLDFGVGCGRVARMFTGFKGRYVGADIDHELVEWAGSALDWVTPLPTQPRQPLPCPDQEFDCVISVSVFSHINEADTRFYIEELYRVTRPGAVLLITIHGVRAWERARGEAKILDMLSIPAKELPSRLFASRLSKGFKFVRQNGHLTSASYDYGITFANPWFVKRAWGQRFVVDRIISGGVHDFQDILVLRRKA